MEIRKPGPKSPAIIGDMPVTREQFCTRVLRLVRLELWHMPPPMLRKALGQVSVPPARPPRRAALSFWPRGGGFTPAADQSLRTTPARCAAARSRADLRLVGHREPGRAQHPRALSHHAAPRLAAQAAHEPQALHLSGARHTAAPTLLAPPGSRAALLAALTIASRSRVARPQAEIRLSPPRPRSQQQLRR
eukprot:5769708-Prymnesium_polylepis.1